MKIHPTHLQFVSLLVMGLVTAACGPKTAPTPSPKNQSAAVTAEFDGVTVEPAAPERIGDQVPAPVPEVEPVEVIYFTPAQQEGPYYPVDKPADRDNDLVNLAGAAALAAGEVLYLSGVVFCADGLPAEGAAIEIWQTDQSGVYQHPDDPNNDLRDPNFQFYGETVTGADGVYSFRTILPGLYEPRPRHIHVKVRYNGEELLTTQFYFAGEVSFNGAEANLLVETAPAENNAGNPIWVGERDIFLRIDQ